MAKRLVRRHWVLLGAVTGLVGMMAISVLAVNREPPHLAIYTRDLPAVSQHAIPRSMQISATTATLPTAIWLVRADDTWRAFSNQTAHPRACEVEWRADLQRFFDPCLGSVFDRTGLNVAGPAPRGLDSYPVATRGENRVEINLSRPQPVSSRP